MVKRYGRRASGLVRLNTAVRSSGVLTDFTEENRCAAPPGVFNRTIRSKLNFTSDEVNSCPFGKVRCSFRLHVYVVGESNWQSAASGTGVGLSGRIVSSVWYRFAWTVREPTSYGPAGSSEVIESVVATRSSISFGDDPPGCGALSSG